MNPQLSAKEIFDILLTGKKIQLIATCAQDPELIRLLGHLNVLKHRSRRIYDMLGLNWDNSIIRIVPPLAKLSPGETTILELIQPKASKKYAAFIIMEEKDESNSN